jgi:hypothetical protein
MGTRKTRSSEAIPAADALHGGLATGVAVIQEHLATLPSSPGVYRMLGARGDAL